VATLADRSISMLNEHATPSLWNRVSRKKTPPRSIPSHRNQKLARGHERCARQTRIGRVRVIRGEAAQEHTLACCAFSKQL
jgi:hypothetical protein